MSTARAFAVAFTGLMAGFAVSVGVRTLSETPPSLRVDEAAPVVPRLQPPSHPGRPVSAGAEPARPEESKPPDEPCALDELECDDQMRSIGCVPPRDFPPEVDGLYDPRTVHGQLEELERSCEGFADHLLYVDCDEYPCIGFFRVDEVNRFMGVDLMNRVLAERSCGSLGADAEMTALLIGTRTIPSAQVDVELRAFTSRDEFDQDMYMRAQMRAQNYSKSELEAMYGL